MGLDGSQDSAEQRHWGRQFVQCVVERATRKYVRLENKTQKNQTATKKTGVEMRKMLLEMVIEIRVMGIKNRFNI